jgi:Rad3-related DNA helicase
MGFRYIDKTLPKMASFMEKILNKYADKKGIIHTHSFKVNKYIVDHLRAYGFGDRIITHDSSKGSRDRAVEDHINNAKPSVLISPSMSEGLDLKEDLSRFQVICKTMFPALDPYVRARMDRDPDWYTLQTALKMVQASGRSVRSKTDKAHTFILDSGFSDWFSRANGMLPDWWTDSIVW